MTTPLFELQQLDPDGRPTGVMPLIGELTLGHAEDADWPIDAAADAPSLLRLAAVGDRVVLTPQLGLVTLAGGAPLDVRRELGLPLSFTFGGLAFRVVDVALAEASPSTDPAAPIASADPADAADPPPFEQLMARLAVPDGLAAPLAGRDGPAPSPRSARDPVRTALAACIAVCVLGLAVQWAATSAHTIGTERAAAAVPDWQRPAAMRSLYAGPPLVEAGATQASTADPVLLGELRSLVRQGGFGNSVEVAMRDGRIELTGELEPAELARLERLSRRFAAQNGLGAGIAFLVEPAESDVPFVVRQVVGGAAPFVVLDSGERLGVGQSAEGYTLVAVEKSRLVFQGRRRVTVEW
jgi:hypothetical protein